MTDQSSIGHMPPAGRRWEFDRSVTSVFDDMIARSIPGYDAMRSVVGDLAGRVLERFDVDPKVVLDLGCSTGIGISQFARHVDRVIGVEVSEPMLEAVRQRFVSYANVEILELDLRRDFPRVSDVGVCLSIFTLQFIPVEHRRRVIADAFRSIRPGGAMIVAEKTIAKTGGAQALLRDSYHRFKVDQGYSTEEVERKALALEGSLVANTAAENEAMLRDAGFTEVEPVWRQGCFGAWLALK